MNEENINEVKNILSILKRTSFVISKKDTFNKIFSDSHLKIDQPIYFYKEDTQEVYEKYNINDRKITRKLGKVTANGFEWMNSVSSNFIKRRSDFHGLILKGMTEFVGTDMRADDSYLTSAPYFPGMYKSQLIGTVKCTAKNLKCVSVLVFSVFKSKQIS